MENSKQGKGISFDQNEKEMLELDDTNTEYKSSTPSTMNLPHRPIFLPPKIKEEQKDKDKEVVPPPNWACCNNVETAVSIQIKNERVEDSDEMPVETPNKWKDRNGGETQNTNQTLVEEPIIQIKTEPIDTPPVATEENSLQNTHTTDATPKNAINKKAKEVSTETNMNDSTAPNSPNGIPESYETLPDNFFDDLLNDADNITAAALECTSPNTTQANLNVKNEPVDTRAFTETTMSAPIPENFFDDLLIDHVAERLDDGVNHNLEIKYAERLRELQQLETNDQSSHKAHKKHKKKKKKSHKRTHSEINIDEESSLRVGSLFPDHLNTNRQRPEPMEIVNLDSNKPETSGSPAGYKIHMKSEFVTDQPVVEEADICLSVKQNELFQQRSNIDRNGLIIDMTAPLSLKRIKLESNVEKSKAEEFILPKDKMENSKQRAILAIEEFNKANNPKDNSFLYTPTMRKLPNSSSYTRQQIYDNRSPLHNVNNVPYKFNSFDNHPNLLEWGIEEMPPEASRVAKILGMDIDSLAKKKEAFQFPPEIQKMKRDRTETNLTHTQTSFLISASTQTGEITVLDASAKRRKNVHDIAVQTIPQGNNIGTQTTARSTTGSNNYDDLPLMRQISTFNENQLMALSDFADLIRESALISGASAMDLYRVRQRMVDIYKCSQMPSELGQNAQQQSQHRIQDPAQEPRIQLMSSPIGQDRPNLWSLPPVWPGPQVVISPPYHRPLESYQYQKTLSMHQPPAPSPVVGRKIPVIPNPVHPNGPLPMDPRQSSIAKYYGRGGLRR